VLNAPPRWRPEQAITNRIGSESPERGASMKVKFIGKDLPVSPRSSDLAAEVEEIIEALRARPNEWAISALPLTRDRKIKPRLPLPL
jgi:hypothetical protein